jgi:hypothetical protein
VSALEVNIAESNREDVNSFLGSAKFGNVLEFQRLDYGDEAGDE